VKFVLKVKRLLVERHLKNSETFRKFPVGGRAIKTATTNRDVTNLRWGGAVDK
jgi:hypothetical protein